jgi:hypothetical protein
MANNNESMISPKEMEKILGDIRRRHGEDAPRRVHDALSRLGEGEDRDRRRGDDRHHRARDAARRWDDDSEGDIESLLEDLLEECGGDLAGALREAANDARGPAHWARDRRERREARDYRGSGYRHHGDGRRLSRDYGPVNVGREEGSPNIEGFGERRGESQREEIGSVGDRRRANDRALALDARDDFSTFRAMFPGAAGIARR